MSRTSTSPSVSAASAAALAPSPRRAGFWSLDADERAVHCTVGLRALLSLPELEGSLPLSVLVEAVAPAGRATFSTAIEMALATGQPLDLDVQMRAADGRHRLVAVTAECEWGQGRVTGLRGVVLDLERGARAEHHLRQRLAECEVALRQAELQAGLGRWHWDFGTGEVQGSEQTFRLFGLDPSRGRAGVRDRHHLYTAESVARLDAAIERALREGSRYDLDLELRGEGSPARWVAVRGEPVCDEQGRVVGLQESVQDITERRQVRRQLADANRLREAIVEAAPLAIIATDADGTIRSVNSAAEQMLGYGRSELVGRHTPALFHDPAELRGAGEAAGKALEDGAVGFRHLLGQAMQGEGEAQEWTYRRKNGSSLIVNLSLSPLRGQDGEVQGYLAIAYDITERKRREEYTRYIAHHDALTGLPNRVLLSDRLDQALARARRSGDKVGVVLLDLDHFKRVNDSLGHHVGDELLKVVSERLRGCVRETDTVARMGGDEFIVLMPDMRDAASVLRVSEQILQRLSRPITVGHHELNVTASMGVCSYPLDGPSAGILLKNADAALYRAKDRGRACVQQFDSELELSVIRRMEIESDLRRALDRQQFCLHFQPQLSLATGRIVGVEALLRWRHPRCGWVSPAEFIPVAEETGLIVPIGAWVMRQACKEVQALSVALDTPLRLGVNLSPRQFVPGTLQAMLDDTLAATGFDPRLLELEITEGVLLGSLGEAERTLEEVGGLGVSVAVDDFGTGYSSLSYIARLPIHTLKIDRAFISRAPGSRRDAAVVQAILAMARSLDIQVVAEGVETTGQLDILRREPVAMAERISVQGFLFSAGQPAEALQAQFRDIEAAALAALGPVA